MNYAASKFEVATFNGFGGDTFTRNLTDAQMHAHTDARMHGQTDGQVDDGPALVRN